MRCFVGIPLDPALAGVVERAQAALARTGADVRFTRRGAVHMTLKFLGEVAPERVPALVAALRVAVTGPAPALGLSGLGAFPERGAPRVLWAGAGGDVDRLAEVARAVEGALGSLGFPAEARAFAPHWTLGRVRSPRHGRELRAEIERRSADVAGEPLPHPRVVLFESRLEPGGSRYLEVGGVTLTP